MNKMIWIEDEFISDTFKWGIGRRGQEKGMEDRFGIHQRADDN